MRLLVVGLCVVAMTFVGAAQAKDLADGKVAGELWEGNDLKIKFRWCPPGTFVMGSPASEADRESREGPVTVKLTRGFWMSQYEITQGEWQTLMVTTINDQKTKAGSDYKLYGEGARYPMYYVNHNEAMEFCKELTDSERSAGRMPAGWEYRLPTEAQWEYACRAGTTTATAFGNSLSSTQANIKGNYSGTTKVVGSYKANAWGLYDMHGNVCEWCRDWFVRTLPGGRDPEVSQPGESSSRLLRGGSWGDSGRYARSATRHSTSPDDGSRGAYFGFRVVCSSLP